MLNPVFLWGDLIPTLGMTSQDGPGERLSFKLDNCDSMLGPALVLRDLRDFSRPQFPNLQDGIIDPTFDEIMWVEYLVQCLALRKYLVIAPKTDQNG